MSTLITELFTGSGTGLGANWTSLIGSYDRTSDMAVPHDVNNQINTAAYSGFGVVPNNQWAQVEIRQQGANSDGGPVVRAALDGSVYYTMDMGDTTSAAVPGSLDLTLFKVTSSSTVFAQVGTDHPTVSIQVGDFLYLEIQGSTLIGKLIRAGSTISTLTGTDSAIASGYPGLFCFSHVTDTPLALINYDNFTAGDFASGFSIDRPRGNRRPFPFLPGSPQQRTDNAQSSMVSERRLAGCGRSAVRYIHDCENRHQSELPLRFLPQSVQVGFETANHGPHGGQQHRHNARHDHLSDHARFDRGVDFWRHSTERDRAYAAAREARR